MPDDNKDNNSRERKSPDLFASYLVGVEAIWITTDPASKEKNPAITERVEALLAECKKPNSDWNELWHNVHLLEQLLAHLMTPPQIVSEFNRRIVDAKSMKIPTAGPIEKKWQAATEAKDTELQRGLFITLLDDLQWAYSKRSLDRRAKFNATRRILWYSVPLIILAVLPFTPLGSFVNSFEDVHGQPFLPLFIAIVFGVLGAFFSRLSTLHSQYMELDYDLIQNLFQARVVGIRLVFGMIGSVVLFFAMSGGLIDGDLFPDFANFSKDPPVNWSIVEEAKLIVWSFIGGFSERLVPDFLSRTEASTQNTDAAP